mmetsp:Transcript_19121/g.44427  ORF Transcript_19121/g.44427 Transcript_19121/m.44427 type:complete len:316 (-) Transcript_19121:161-1108(-)
MPRGSRDRAEPTGKPRTDRELPSLRGRPGDLLQRPPERAEGAGDGGAAEAHPEAPGGTAGSRQAPGGVEDLRRVPRSGSGFPKGGPRRERPIGRVPRERQGQAPEANVQGGRRGIGQATAEEAAAAEGEEEARKEAGRLSNRPIDWSRRRGSARDRRDRALPSFSTGLFHPGAGATRCMRDAMYIFLNRKSELIILTAVWSPPHTVSRCAAPRIHGYRRERGSRPPGTGRRFADRRGRSGFRAVVVVFKRTIRPSAPMTEYVRTRSARLRSVSNIPRFFRRFRRRGQRKRRKPTPSVFASVDFFAVISANEGRMR